MEESNQNRKISLIGMSLQLGFSVVSSTLFFSFLGIYLDSKFKSTPIFIIIGLALGFLFSMYLVFRIVKSTTNKISEEEKK